jgi:hypothetical protein
MRQILTAAHSRECIWVQAPGVLPLAEFLVSLIMT